MTVDPADSAGTHLYKDVSYYFCCDSCRTKFARDPERYLDPARRDEQEPAIEGATYTCPMHPEVSQDHPGTCPICHMQLEPIPPERRGGSRDDHGGGASDGGAPALFQFQTRSPSRLDVACRLRLKHGAELFSGARRRHHAQGLEFLLHFRA